jgi:RNA polymerase sigma factor (sigma-70 family)
MVGGILMAGEHFGTVLRYLRKLSGGLDLGAQSDAVLLNRFATERDETAFGCLMQRYGPMVLGVGRRILGNSSDAEDAFQATFFVLARKAGSISRPEQLGNWLYGVAYRTALKARTEMGRRRLREHLAPPRPTSDNLQEAVWRDLRPILDEEVNRLPAKYRAAFLLCHVEGKTNTEAARQLRCPVGTILSRLARARRQLRNRLTRRGVTLSVALVTSSLSRETLAAEISAELIQSTVRTALSFAAVSGISQSFAAILAEGVLKAMFLSKIKTIGLSLLAVGLIAGGLGLYASRVPAAASTLPQKSPPLNSDDFKADQDKDKPKQETDNTKERIELRVNEKIQALLKEKLETANLEQDARMKEFLAGRGTLDFLFAGSRRLLEAQRDMSDKKEDQVAALEAHWQRMKQIEELNKKRFDAGRIGIQDYAESKYYRLEAEVWLEKAKAK